MSNDEKGCEASGIKMKRAMYAYGRLVSGMKTSKEIEDATNWNYQVVYGALKDLVDMGLIRGAREHEDYKAEPYIYTIVADKELPEGWTVEACVSMEAPPVPTRHGGTKKIEVADNSRDNPMTRALAKGTVYIPEESLRSYTAYIEDFKNIPKRGIKEVDDIIQATLELVMERCRHINRKCPVCDKGRLEALGTRITCQNKKCAVTADSKKSIEMSIKMLKALR